MKQDIQKPTEQLSDEDLVLLVRADQEYLDVLFERYEAPLLRYLKRLLSVSHETCEDVLQEVFIKVYKKLNSFDASLKFSSWIYRITRNEAISYYRKNKKKMEELSINAEEEQNYLKILKDDTDLEQELRDQELAYKVKRILDKMSPKYREVLILKYMEEKDYQEMSAILRKPIGTIGTLLNRAKKEFKKKYS